MNEKYISTKLEEYSKSLSQIPAIFSKQKREMDRQIDLLCERAGILDQILALRDNLEKQKTQLQSQADVLNGRMQQLREIHKEFYETPIPKGMKEKHGIPLEPLDAQTRMMVLDDNPDTVAALGGKLETSEDQEFHGQEEVIDWDFKAHWKTKVARALELYEKDPDLFEKVYEQETSQIRRHIDNNLPDQDYFEDYEDSFEESEEPEESEEMTREEIEMMLKEAERTMTTPRQKSRLAEMKKQYGID